MKFIKKFIIIQMSLKKEQLIDTYHLALLKCNRKNTNHFKLHIKNLKVIEQFNIVSSLFNSNSLKLRKIESELESSMDQSEDTSPYACREGIEEYIVCDYNGVKIIIYITESSVPLNSYRIHIHSKFLSINKLICASEKAIEEEIKKVLKECEPLEINKVLYKNVNIKSDILFIF